MTKTPRFQASDSVTLMLSLVPYLLDEGTVSVDEAATNFGVSQETIRSTVRGLTTLGVADRDGTVQSDNMFDIDWDQLDDEDIITLTHSVAIDGTPRLSAREAATLLAGLSLIKYAVDEKNRRLVDDLATKIARGSSGSPASITVAALKPPAGLATVQHAIALGKHIRFDYQSGSSSSVSRLVDPLRVEAVSDTWYLRGYCHLREDLRTFRVDRLVKLEIDSLDQDTILNATDLDDALFDVSDTDIVATLSLPLWALPALSDFGPRTLTSDKDRVTVEVNFASPASVYRALARRPGSIVVDAPESLRQQVAAWAAEAL